jgi:hypothetical protein
MVFKEMLDIHGMAITLLLMKAKKTDIYMTDKVTVGAPLC